MIFSAKSFAYKQVRERKPPLEDMLENRLQSYLSPIQPNPDFVMRLKTRLTTEPNVMIERRYKMAAFVVAASGLFIGAFIVWLVYFIRSLILREPVKNAS